MIRLRTSRFRYLFTKGSIVLKPTIGIVNSFFITINEITKLSFKLEIQTLNVTIPSLCNSVSFAALYFIPDVFIPKNVSDDSIFMV